MRHAELQQPLLEPYGRLTFLNLDSFSKQYQFSMVGYARDQELAERLWVHQVTIS